MSLTWRDVETGLEAALDLIVGMLKRPVLARQELGADLDGLFEFTGALGQGVDSQPQDPPQ